MKRRIPAAWATWLLVVAGAVAQTPTDTPPDPDPEPRPSRARAHALLGEGRAEDAASEFAAVLEVDPADVDAAEGRIRSLVRAQRWRQALDESAAMVGRWPAEPRIATARSETLFRAGRLEEATSILEAIVEGERVPPRARVVLGRLRNARGRWSEAVELMRSAVAGAPHDPEVLFWASGATASRAEAIELLTRYLESGRGQDPDRLESARGSLRLFEALGERPIWVSATRPETAEIPLRLLWEPETGALIGFVVEVRLGGKGKPVPLLLDSGSPGLYVSRRIAAKRDFEPLTHETAFGGGGDQRHRTGRGVFARAAIGELEFETALASTTEREYDPTGRFHGLIGLSVFNGYRVTIDLANKQLALRLTGGDENGEPYWTVAGQCLVRGELGDDRRGGMLLLDTGATRTLVSDEWASRLPGAVQGREVRVHGFGGLRRGARTLEGVRVAFGGLEGRGPFRTADLAVRSRVAGVEIAGFLGLDLLTRATLVVDTVGRRVRVIRTEDEGRRAQPTIRKR